MMDFDATSLYSSSMGEKNSVYPRIEGGFAFKPHMNDVYKEVFNNQTSNQEGNESSILKNIYFIIHLIHFFNIY